MSKFYSFCSKVPGESQIKVRKFTYDKKIYFLVPSMHQSLDDHPFIKHSKHSNFSKLVNASGGYRHVAMPMKDSNGKNSKEAEHYINKDGEFVINNVKLIQETGRYHLN